MRLFVYGNPSRCLRNLINGIDQYGAENEVSCYSKIIEFDENKESRYNLFDDEDLAELERADAVVTWGTWGSNHQKRKWHPHGPRLNQGLKEVVNRNIRWLAQAQHKPHLVTETATLSRCRTNAFDTKVSFKSIFPQYYRLGLNHWTYSRSVWCEPGEEDRLAKFEKRFYKGHQFELNLRDHSWKNSKKSRSCIWILPGLEQDPTSSVPVLHWVESTVEQLRTKTSRGIVIKPHPLSSLTFDHIAKQHRRIKIHDRHDQTMFKDLINKMYCAVVDSSTSVFELITLGIPVFCTEHSFAAPLGNTNLNNINDIFYPSDQQYQKWLQQMSYTEFSVEEWNNGEILPYIKQLIKQRKSK